MDVTSNVTSDSPHSYLIDYSKDDFEWIRLPDYIPRSDFACGHVKADDGQRYIVVAGGNNDTVQMLSLENPVEWIQGPAIPVATYQSAEFQFQDTFLVTGGYNSYRRDSVYEFRSDLQWHLRKSLKNGRDSHVIFPIPDEWANCY